MTKHISIIFFTLLLFTGLINGCQNQFKATVKSDQNSVLWQINKDGYPTSYLFGTMHLINRSHYNFSKNLTAIVKSSDKIIMELGGMPNPIQAMLLITNKKGTLKDIFTDHQWQEILVFYKKEFEMTESKFISTYNNFKPFFLFQSLAQSYFSSDAESYDMNIIQMARENNIEVIGLETIEEQIGFFDAIPDTTMANMIMESLESYQADAAEFEKLQALYAEENIEALIPLMKEQSPEFLKFEDIFLSNRNRKWIPTLEVLLAENSCLIAVGAAHLFEENGLISLLKQKGFTVNPIKK
jgi:uncharacterized protein YbaP (TraB family)